MGTRWTRQHQTREERRWEAEWALSPRPLLSKTRSPLIRAHSVSSAHQERLHVLVSRPRENSKQHLKELAVLESEPLPCGGKALQLVCAAMPRLPAPPSNFQRRAFSFTKRGFCNSRRLWPTLVWLTWYGLLAGRKVTDLLSSLIQFIHRSLNCQKCPHRLHPPA